MIIRTLDELFAHELIDLYDAEHQIMQALPKMIGVATFADLKLTLNDHFQETKVQIQRLDQVFVLLNKKVSPQPCEAMRSILREGNVVIEQTLGGAIRDAAIISAAQRIEHYEIAGYGTARTYAYLLGHGQIAQKLQETLDEEEQADKKLTQVANSINAIAME